MTKLTLFLEGSQKGIEKLRDLHESKQLEILLGTSVLGIEFEINKTPFDPLGALSSLGHWLRNIFEISWQEPQLVLAPAYRSRSSKVGDYPIVRAKEINLDSDRQLALLIKLKPLDDENIQVMAQIHPVNNQYVPLDLTLSLLDDSGAQVIDEQGEQVEAKPDSDRTAYIQLDPFIVSRGEYFSLEITCSDDSITEDFMF